MIDPGSSSDEDRFRRMVAASKIEGARPPPFAGGLLDVLIFVVLLLSLAHLILE